MIGLDLLDGHAGNRYIKLANGATACHCLPFCLHTVCVCLPARSSQSDIDAHEARCSISSLSDSYSAAENDIVSGFSTHYLSTRLCKMQHDTVLSCFLLYIFGGNQNISPKSMAGGTRMVSLGLLVI